MSKDLLLKTFVMILFITLTTSMLNAQVCAFQEVKKPFMMINIGTGIGINNVSHWYENHNQTTTMGDIGLTVNFPIKLKPLNNLAAGIDLRYASNDGYASFNDEYSLIFIGGNIMLNPGTIGFFSLSPGVVLGDVTHTCGTEQSIKPKFSMRLTSGIELGNTIKTGSTGVFLNHYRGKVDDDHLVSTTVGLFLDARFNIFTKN